MKWGWCSGSGRSTGGGSGARAGTPDAELSARAALLKDYERQDLLRITDPELRDQVAGVLEASPSDIVPPEQVDFTPYWKRPIPASYFPD